MLFPFLAPDFARTTPNPAHQRADGLDPTKQADQNQRKLVANLEARLNKVNIVLLHKVGCAMKLSFAVRRKKLSGDNRLKHGVHVTLPTVLLVVIFSAIVSF